MDKNEYTMNFLREMLGGDNLPDWSDQEWAALCEEAPMTQELFESCLNACAEAGNLAEFVELFERFPECGKVWTEELDKELDAITAFLEVEEVKLSDKDIQARWTAFRNRMRDEYGDEVADNLPEDIFSIS